MKDKTFEATNSKVTPSTHIDTYQDREAFSTTVLRSSPDSSDYCSSLEEEPVHVTDFLDTFCGSNESLNSSKVDNDRRNTETKSGKSDSSTSPLKIPTPIKDMIRLKNSPNVTGKNHYTGRSPDNVTSPLKGSTKENCTVGNRRSKKLAHSGNILNFKAYINPVDSDTRETVEDVRTYLNFADSGQV